MLAISVVVHPLFMATYCCFVFYWIGPQLFLPLGYEAIPYFILVIFFTTCIVPGLIIGFLRITKRISNLDISQREERLLPFFSTAVFYGVTTFLLDSKIGLSQTLFTVLCTVTALLFIVLLISFHIKISVHAAGIWGALGIVCSIAMKHQLENTLLTLTIGFLAAGLTVTSRLYLQAHTPKESWGGAFLGFSFCFISIALLTY